MTRTILLALAFALTGLVVDVAAMGSELTAPVSSGTSPAASRFQPLPAASKPPLNQAQGQEAERAGKSINQGRLSKQQLRQTLLNHPNPRIREKAQEAQKFSTYQTTKVFAGGSVTLTPQAAYSPLPTAWLQFYGANVVNEPSGVATFIMPESSGPGAAPIGGTISKAMANLDIAIPSTGWYLIDFYGYGHPKATLRTWIDDSSLGSYPVLESWDMTTSPTPYSHFTTAEYLAKGWHNFYFTIDKNVLYLYEVSVEAF
jgi:hypothetical protein